VPSHPPDQPSAAPIKGAPLAAELKASIAARAERLTAAGHQPVLVAVIGSSDGAVRSYAESKARAAAKLGIELRLVEMEDGTDQAALEHVLTGLSEDPAIHGIMLELPLDARFDENRAIACIDPAKDVDGLTPVNLGLIAAGREAEALAPATPLACIRLAETEGSLRGRPVVLIGRGRTVGRALIPMLVNRDATVTVCHTRTRDLAAAIAPAEIIFVAAGRPGLLTPDLVLPGQIVIDAGINPTETGIVGDADPAIATVVRAYTPVPGGVGPLTSTLIFDNLLRAMALQGLPGAAP